MDKYPFLREAGSSFKDRDVTKMSDLIEKWDGQGIKGPALIGAPCQNHPSVIPALPSPPEQSARL